MEGVYNPFSTQVGGSHYKSMKIQPVEFILANDLGFCEGNIIKYTCRYRQKGGIQDLEKVIHYAELLIKAIKESKNEQETSTRGASSLDQNPVEGPDQIDRRLLSVRLYE